MFTEKEQTNLKEVASALQHLGAQIDEMATIGPGAETQVLDIVTDIRQALLRSERVLQFIQVDVECRI